MPKREASGRDDQRKPWYKKFPKDWLGDAELRLCDLASRGLLADLMDVAHGGSPEGYITRRNGQEYTESELCEILHVRPTTYRKKLAVLLDRGRVERDKESGHLYIGRMVRDAARLEQAREFGGRGGNPRLRGKRKGSDELTLWELKQVKEELDNRWAQIAGKDTPEVRDVHQRLRKIRKQIRDYNLPET